MDESISDNESLVARVKQLEHERDELRKDIEQLCIQQAGPSYLVVATKLHFQRTAGLEQEIETLKKKVAASARENINLEEELSEAYRIKSQLAELHGTELSKNTEAEKQLKFFRGCVADAFAERDNSIMEAEKAKEKEELMSKKFSDLQERMEEHMSNCFEEKELISSLRFELAKQEEQNETFKKVVNKFSEIRKQSIDDFEESSWDDKCTCLLDDPVEMWSFSSDMETSTSKYISTLEEEIKRMKSSMDKFQSKLRVGLEIENHLRKKVSELEKKKVLSEERIQKGFLWLLQYHSHHRDHIMHLLNEGKSHIKLMMDMVEEKFRQLDLRREHNSQHAEGHVKLDENECRDVHISFDADVPGEMNCPDLPSITDDREGDVSKALAQALQDKVAALLLMSQQEERHLLERNVNAALQQKTEELQRNLLQVTNEKVRALVELAQLKQEYQQFQEKISREIEQGKSLSDIVGKGIVTQAKDGKLTNMFRKTYLRRWIGTLDFSGTEAGTHSSNEVNSASRKTDMDFARMRIENATLKESMESIEHLTSSIHRLRLSLVKARDAITSEDPSTPGPLNDIITEAKLVKTALGSSLPISWSAESENSENIGNVLENVHEEHSSEKLDSVSAVGFEMVELLILATEILKDKARL